MNIRSEFCRLIRSRSKENAEAFSVLFQNRNYGNCLSVLRQELDSLVRVLFLLNQQPDVQDDLIKQLFDNKKWSIINQKGKSEIITDKIMVDLADSLDGWENSVYKFGCSFIHLSNNHDYLLNDPIAALSPAERKTIKDHIQYYHFIQLSNNYSINDIIQILPAIMEKVSNNLETIYQRYKYFSFAPRPPGVRRSGKRVQDWD